MKRKTAIEIKDNPYESVNEFKQAIKNEFPTLSKQLKKVARFFEHTSNDLVFTNVREVAKQCDTQPSTIVRFANHFGFSGYLTIRKLYQKEVLAKVNFKQNYHERVKDMLADKNFPNTPQEITKKIISTVIDSAESLKSSVDSMPINLAVEAMVHAPCIWVVGFRRSYPVASYLSYVLQHLPKKIIQVSGAGGFTESVAEAINPDDVLLVVSFYKYSQESIFITNAAKKRQAKIITITDSNMSEIADCTDINIVIQESSVYGFRLLNNAITIAQSLFMALAYRLEKTQ